MAHTLATNIIPMDSASWTSSPLPIHAGST